MKALIIKQRKANVIIARPPAAATGERGDGGGKAVRQGPQRAVRYGAAMSKEARRRYLGSLNTFGKALG